MFNPLPLPRKTPIKQRAPMSWPHNHEKLFWQKYLPAHTCKSANEALPFAIPTKLWNEPTPCIILIYLKMKLDGSLWSLRTTSNEEVNLPFPLSTSRYACVHVWLSHPVCIPPFQDFVPPKFVEFWKTAYFMDIFCAFLMESFIFCIVCFIMVVYNFITLARYYILLVRIFHHTIYGFWKIVILWIFFSHLS